jgi:hypothetical protein
MNSQATSVTGWMGHRSAIAARLFYLQEIDRTAFLEFATVSPPEQTSSGRVRLVPPTAEVDRLKRPPTDVALLLLGVKRGLLGLRLLH